MEKKTLMKKMTTPLSLPSRQEGGVYIANANGIRGDIVSSDGDKYVVRLRGSKEGDEITIDKQELVEYTTTSSTREQLASTRQEEELHHYLYQMAAQNPEEFYLQERVLTIDLGDEFTYLVVTNSVDDESLPTDVEGEALVRLVEAYYIGQGSVVGANGRHLASFHKALQPFWTIDNNNNQDGEFTKLSGKTAGDYLENLAGIFETGDETITNGRIFFRAFAYAHHRLDYHKQEEEESLLDAYCVTFYVIKLLQGKMNTVNIDFASLIDQEFSKYKSEDVDMTVDDLLWCFCILLLRIGSDVRRYKGLHGYNTFFPDSYDLTVNEELFVCQLAMELRPDSPVSFLSSYRMVMDTKAIIPEPKRIDWMKHAHEYAVRGLKTSERWGDPFFQYTFQSIVAYWLPTTTNAPNAYSLKEIVSRIKVAGEHKIKAKKYEPEYLFWIGHQHETCLKKALEPFLATLNQNIELTIPLVDAYFYKPLGTKQSSPEKQSNERPLPSSSLGPYTCAHCSKEVQQCLRCARCGKTHYCSKACQTAHWKASHKRECKPCTK